MKISKFGMSFAAIATVAMLAGCSAANPAESTSPSAAAPAAWSYSGDNGPANWGTLDAKYTTCVDGTAQSPIDIVGAVPTDLKNIEFTLPASEAGVFNNGHTVEAEPLTEGTEFVTIDDVKYNFAQFHFHAPSEHIIDGKQYPLEVHFVNKTEDGKIAVVGVLVEEGAENAAWAPFIADIASATSDPEANKVELDWAAMLPAVQTTYRYDGSLTTPGCAEGVKWNVMSTTITMSKDQIAAFTAAYSLNARPVQPLNGREILLDSTK
ncbi:MAG: carbonic anhydrase [Micrococcales bacterium]